MTLENILKLAADPNVQYLATTIVLGVVGMFAHKPIRRAINARKDVAGK